MLENEANQPHLLERPTGQTKLYDAQWGDDFHNALHVLLTGENEGYYSAFAYKPLEHLARSLTEGFAYQGEVFPLHNAPRGQPSGHLPPEATIFFAQNHDQVGNRALGERLAKLVNDEKLKQAMVLLILNPHIPMLFMGEEAAAQTPFLFLPIGRAKPPISPGRDAARSSPILRRSRHGSCVRGFPTPVTKPHSWPRNSSGACSIVPQSAGTFGYSPKRF
jgi:hypothetical protein